MSVSMDESMERIGNAKHLPKGTVLAYERENSVTIFVLLEDHLSTNLYGGGTLALILCGRVLGYTEGMTRRMKGIISASRELP